jgi:hypothetical protein
MNEEVLGRKIGRMEFSAKGASFMLSLEHGPRSCKFKNASAESAIQISANP